MIAERFAPHTARSLCLSTPTLATGLKGSTARANSQAGRDQLLQRISSAKRSARPAGDAFHEVIDRRERTWLGGGRRPLQNVHRPSPAVGQTVGAYWWGWQLRGQESGGIDETYTLKTSRR